MKTATRKPWPGRWRRELVISADEWATGVDHWAHLPPVSPGPMLAERVNAGTERSPCGEWAFARLLLPGGYPIACCNGIGQRGAVRFDGDVIVPALWQRDAGRSWEETFRRGPLPWMSVTPQEVITMRPGTRLARGRTIVAGLGLGMQAIDVARKRSVTEVVVIERDAGLAKWIWPKVLDAAGASASKLSLIIDDAWSALRTAQADATLIDVFKRLGGNCFPAGFKAHPGLGVVWLWGQAEIEGAPW